MAHFSSENRWTLRIVLSSELQETLHIQLLGIRKNSILLSCKMESLFSFVSHQEFFLKWTCPLKGFPDGSAGKKSACSGRDASLIPGLARSPGKGKWPPTPVFLPEKSHGQGSLEGYSPKGHRESDMTDHLRTHTYTHSGYGGVYSWWCFDIHVWDTPLNCREKQYGIDYRENT